MQTRLRALLALVLAFAATRAALGQCPVATAPQGTGAIDRGRAIVTEPHNPPHVHFYDKTGRGWQLRETHVVGDLPDVFFHTSVAIDGDRAIAGSPESTTVPGQVFLGGRAFIFDRVGDHWIPTELIPSTSHEMDLFGETVAVDGDVAVVGAPHSSPYGDGLARLHVFEFDGTSWWEVAQLTPYRSESAIDVAGDTIVVGDEHPFPGRVHVFHRTAGQWTPAQLLVLPTPPGGPRLGNSVALQGDTLAVGTAATSSSVPSFVQIFRRLANGWRPAERLFPEQGEPLDGFGHAVALSGPTLLVGAPWAGQAGAVHRFEHDGTSFFEVDRFDAQPGSQGLGEHVALHREDAIVSAYPDLLFYRLGFAEVASFCPTTPNSTGSPGKLGVEGCDSLDGRRLTLHASHLPPGVLGRAFFGTSATQVPFGDGYRCVGSPLYRLPVAAADAAGHLVCDLDFSADPAAHITAGPTWHFQLYYRDPQSSGALLNVTNALSIAITP